MKKILFLTAITLFGIGCTKEVPTTNNAELQKAVNATTAGSVQAVPINYQETFEIQASIWNSCTQEFIDFSGTGQGHIRGMISNNKITFVLHINYSNVKGVGQNSGTEYVVTSTFNYSNTENFNTQLVYQQRATTNYIAVGNTGNLTIENDWHLTINANGEVTFFFSTGGDVIKCQ